MDRRAGYQEWPAPAASAGSVACLWSRVVGSGGADPALVLPDGCVDVIWCSGGDPLVAGPDTGPAPVRLASGTVLIGARFRPGAGGPALGLPLHELRDRRVALGDVAPQLARRLPGHLSPTEAHQRVVRLAGELAEAGPPDLLVAEAARRLDASQTTGMVARGLFLSERQLRRRFDAAVGYGPKTLHRVLRFRRFLAGVESRSAGVGLARLASAAGYADQAHLTRETRELSGMTPRELVGLWRR
ncbi:MAG TPA: DUF6597 domain-containing transcriptional factor [Actinomycetota bacterium]|nr:DUF6597 domain-containing transcriptional factor [Actinomycetota bacterium]